MTLDEFIASQADKDAVFPGVDANQCMALLHLYLQDVLGITDPSTLAQPSAFQIFKDFDQVPGHESFQKIENTPEGVPQAGDIMVYDSGANGSPDGHVCIFIEGDVNNFRSFDSNFPVGSKPHVQEHDYNGILGWLRYIPGTPATETPAPEAPADNTYKGIDLNNPESVKAAIDGWADLASGSYMLVSDHEATMKLIADNVGNETVPDPDHIVAGIVALHATITELQNKPAEQLPVTAENVAAATDSGAVASNPGLHNLFMELFNFFSKKS